MNIVINTQLLLPERLDGIGWFTFETVRRITQGHPEHHFILVFDRKPSLQFPKNTRCIVLPPQSRHPFLWFLRFEILLPFLLRRLKADVFVSPDGWMTLNSPIPCVQILHDLNFMHYPKGLDYLTRTYYRNLFPRYAKKARIVGTVSEYSKQDIIKTIGIAGEKIEVMHNGCNPIYQPKGYETDKNTRNNFTNGKPYFLYVGALIPRKNVVRMLQAFELFKKEDKREVQFLIVGSTKNLQKEIRETIDTMEYGKEVHFLGRRQVEDLALLYSAAEALVFVPIFEGFGIPIVEGFYAETAVITSNVSSMPEVAGDAAYLADPFSVKSICKAMLALSTDPSLRQSLIEKARLRRKLFSWDHTAQRFWETIEKALY